MKTPPGGNVVVGSGPIRGARLRPLAAGIRAGLNRLKWPHGASMSRVNVSADTSGRRMSTALLGQCA
jgi:hypothetical protein